MSFLWFLIIGAVAGWLAGTLVKGGGFGLLGDIVVGIIGAFVGGDLFRTFGVSAGGGLIGGILGSDRGCRRVAAGDPACQARVVGHRRTSIRRRFGPCTGLA